MNTKLSFCLIAMTTILYGCAATPKSGTVVSGVISNPVIIGDGNKVVGDGSHLLGLPMTRDFILESRNGYQETDIDFQEKGSQGSKKIFSIKPTGSVQPRAVILLENKMLPSSPWKIWDYNWNVRRKNIEICKGFMALQPATPGTSPDSQQIRDNEVITFMPVKTGKKITLPKKLND